MFLNKMGFILLAAVTVTAISEATVLTVGPGGKYDFESIQSMFLFEGTEASLEKWFAILELDKNASNDEIKKAHRKMVIKYHPDKLQGVSQDIKKLAEEKFLLVQQAYENIMKSRS